MNIEEKLSELGASNDVLKKLEKKLAELEKKDNIEKIIIEGKLAELIKDFTRKQTLDQDQINKEKFYLKGILLYNELIENQYVGFDDFLMMLLKSIDIELPEVFYSPPKIDPLTLIKIDVISGVKEVEEISQKDFLIDFPPGSLKQEDNKIFKIDAGPTKKDWEEDYRYFDLTKTNWKFQVIEKRKDNTHVLNFSDLTGYYINKNILEKGFKKVDYPRICARCLSIYDGFENEDVEINGEVLLCKNCRGKSEKRDDKINLYRTLFETSRLIATYPILSKQVIRNKEFYKNAEKCNISKILFNFGFSEFNFSENTDVSLNLHGINRSVSLESLGKNTKRDFGGSKIDLFYYFYWAKKRLSQGESIIRYKIKSDDGKFYPAIINGSIWKTDALELKIDDEFFNNYSLENLTFSEDLNLILCLIYHKLVNEHSIPNFTAINLLEFLADFIYLSNDSLEETNDLISIIKKQTIVINNQLLKIIAEDNPLIICKKIFDEINNKHSNNNETNFEYNFKEVFSGGFGAFDLTCYLIYLHEIHDNRTNLDIRTNMPKLLEKISKIKISETTKRNWLKATKYHTLAHLSHSAAVDTACCEENNLGITFDSNSISIFDNNDGGIGYSKTIFENIFTKREENIIRQQWIIGFLSRLDGLVRSCPNKVANEFLFNTTHIFSTLTESNFSNYIELELLINKVLNEATKYDEDIRNDLVVQLLGIIFSYVQMLITQRVASIFWLLKKINFNYEDFSLAKWCYRGIFTRIFYSLSKEDKKILSENILGIDLPKNFPIFNIKSLHKMILSFQDKIAVCYDGCPDCALIQSFICQQSSFEQLFYINRGLLEKEYYQIYNEYIYEVNENSHEKDISEFLIKKGGGFVIIPMNDYLKGRSTLIDDVIGYIRRFEKVASDNSDENIIQKNPSTPSIIYWKNNLAFLYQFSKNI